MAEEGEDDYMSDKFLFAAETVPKSTLMTSQASRKARREDRIKERQKLAKKNKPIKVIEKERRDDKLNTPLDESNKGFALLAKMGFKSGMGLGKDGSGRSEPIPLNIKTGRGGIGQERHVAEKKSKAVTSLLKARVRRERMNEVLKGDFQIRMKDKFVTKQIDRDLGKSQTACEQLDSSKGLSCIENWYWRQPIKEVEDNSEALDEQEDSEEEGPSASEKLVALTTYLRSTHFYCIWCGTAFNDQSDIDGNCPGDTFEDHND